MKIVEAANKVVQCVQSQGLFLCQMEHEVKSTQSNFDWTGPKISPQVWHQILAFFKWSHDKTRSEAQVRLFVNPRLRQWEAWAFPQICGTGMSTNEINESTAEFHAGRARFKDSEGWLPFGSVHHHCTAGAFQSGTDKHNEHDQDGLHITVGHMDSKEYDLHVRFYCKQSKYQPDLNVLWDIGDVMADVPEWARALLPADTEHRIAESQMCQPAPEGTVFPDEWKANLVEKKVETTPERRWELKYEGFNHQMQASNIKSVMPWQVRDALKELKEAYPDMELAMIYQWLGQFIEDEDFQNIFKICQDNDVDPNRLLIEIEHAITMEELNEINGGDTKKIDSTGWEGMEQ